MKIGIRIVAGLTLLLAVAGLLLFLAGAVGVWIVKEPATERATHVFERIETALSAADKGLNHVKTSLANASERLDTVRKDQRKLAQQPQWGGVLGRMLAQTVAPQLSNAHETLHTVAEAAVVVNSILEDVGNFPFLSVSGLDVSSLSEINKRLSDVGPRAWELSRLLGGSGPEPNAETASNQLSRIDQALKSMQGLIAAYEPQLRQVRQRTEELKSRTLAWITPGAVLVSLVCLWLALSQVSLLCHAWSWWRRAGHNNTRAG
jgi:hypothetical protein